MATDDPAYHRRNCRCAAHPENKGKYYMCKGHYYQVRCRTYQTNTHGSSPKDPANREGRARYGVFIE